MNTRLLTPSADIFAPFGSLIQMPSEKATVSTEFFDYWHNVCDLSSLEMKEPVVGFLRVVKREFVLNKMEKHVLSDEIFIPLTGYGVFSLCPAENDPSKEPDKITHFFIGSESAFLLRKGTWHWAPYPLTDEMRFLIIVDKATVERDIHIVEFETPVRIL
ncbi:ureidoglycolate lyase [Thermotoga sp. KOL6]|uniref:ureidoglycolate lyase n=1 Tax=Thermotoga sp. KOL6 TaxID=126741 RepID=UPI000C760C76|nr:ureidoglycolate lyase [Thermotoga sp. KOL6]PLV59042.1 hypothetical protein AS005_04600 [Thermotoga sp. KOL6]